MGQRLLFGCVHHRFKCVEAGVNRLYPQLPFKTSANDQHHRAVHQRPDRKHKARAFTWVPSHAFSETLAQQIERRPALVQRRWFAHAIEQNFISMAVGQSELDVAVYGFAQRVSLAKSGKKLTASPQAKRGENVVAMTITLVDRGRRRA